MLDAADESINRSSMLNIEAFLATTRCASRLDNRTDGTGPVSRRPRSPASFPVNTMAARSGLIERRTLASPSPIIWTPSSVMMSLYDHSPAGTVIGCPWALATWAQYRNATTLSGPLGTHPNDLMLRD